MEQLLIKLNQRNVKILVLGEDQLTIDAPKGALTPELIAEIKMHKPRLLTLFRESAQHIGLPELVPHPELLHAPFALTDVQHAYWMGRNNYVELGGVSTHYYVELESEGLDIEKLNIGLQKTILRHDMLRAVIEPDGRQRILPVVPAYEMCCLDLKGLPPEQQEAALEALREKMSHQVLPAGQWPLFDIKATQLDKNRLRLHISLDMLILDVWSITLFAQEWCHFYQVPTWSPPALALSYRDYIETEQALQNHPLYIRSQNYWLKRIDSMPAAPDLPLAMLPEQVGRPHFTRRRAVMPAMQWLRLKERAKEAGLTPSSVILAAFAEVLRLWSRQPNFTLNMTLFNRLPLSPQINQLIGDFTSLNLMSVQVQPDTSFIVRVKQLQAQLAQDLEHLHFNGIKVMREKARHLGNALAATMPIVFTSSIGLNTLNTRDDQPDVAQFFGDYVYGISQTPQVWLDHQVTEEQGQLVYNWDAVEALFPTGLMDDMFGSYNDFLSYLGRDDTVWSDTHCLPQLPAWQIAERVQANATELAIPAGTLHGLVARQAARRPDAVAVVTEERELSYRELSLYAYRLARRLHDLRVKPNTLVAVAMEKGWEQVAAVLGILHSGAAYLPIDPGLPYERRAVLIEQGEVGIVITQSHLRDQLQWPQGIELILLENMGDTDALAVPTPVVSSPEDIAYVIFTSGSTGVPKGVTIDHRAACNTVQDINQRFNVGENDRILALSALNFDLSVYDIFGVLGAGGVIVIPSPQKALDPAHWSQLIADHRITIWNSVPALLQIWGDYVQSHAGVTVPDLRLAMLSGDWIPVKLPDQIRTFCPELQMISLGGATEAAIWSVSYPIADVSPEWKSIAYGKPLSNQTLHIFNEWFQPSPVWATGYLYIGGMGLAKGYWRDLEKTQEAFITHPETGERLYKTGDLGRYLPGGDIEFLGREDFQVKINGFRIELGEIATHLRRQPEVRDAIVNVAINPDNGHRQLAAYIVPETGVEFHIDNVSAALANVLPDYMVPHHMMLLESFPLTVNGKIDYKLLPAPWTAGNRLENWIAPGNNTEQRLFDIWKELLGHANFGVEENFFALGGDSLSMVKISGLVQETFRLSRIPQQEILEHLFAGPTISTLAKAIDIWLKTDQDKFNSDKKQELPLLPLLPLVIPDKENLYVPFPPSDLQLAFLSGETADMEYYVRPNYYLELDFDTLDIARYEGAFNAALYRQRNNLVVVTEDMQMQTLRTFTPLQLKICDFRAMSEEAQQQALLETRLAMSRRLLPLDKWPWVFFRATIYGNDQVRIHVNNNNFYIDAFGGGNVMADAMHYYHHPDQPLPELTVSFRDCVLALKEIEASPLGQESMRYWLDRLPGLPNPPSIARVTTENTRTRSHLQRRGMMLPEKTWSAFKAKATKFGLTPTNAVFAVYAEVLAQWSGSRHFLLNNMVTQRLPFHPQVRDIAANLSTLYPFEIDMREPAPFYQRARNIQQRIVLDTQHSYYGGLKVLRALNQHQKMPGQAPSPFVVVSALEMEPIEKPYYGCLETPQVLLDHQFWNLADGRFWVIWDVIERFFPEGVINGMWDAYRSLLISLSEDEEAWSHDRFDLLPIVQHQERSLINHTTEVVPEDMLHQRLGKNAEQFSDKTVVISATGNLTFAQLHGRSNNLAHRLRAAGAQPNQLVAVLLDKGWEQMVAVYGIQTAGAAYVPVDPDWPPTRIDYLLNNTQAKIVVTRFGLRQRLSLPETVEVMCVDAPDMTDWPDTPLVSVQDTEDLAYVIYTSGSTGNPKGVMIDHRAALNTVIDINRRFGITHEDVIFGISSLYFDLSVYDLFGSVATGATLVLPAASEVTSPTAWLDTMLAQGVTVWNSTPSLMQLLVDAAEATAVTLPLLKTVMLSGDWIPVNLPLRIQKIAPNARIISLGGATEAAIWSIYYPVDHHDDGRISIPYGKPLGNQRWHILNEQGNDVPVWTPGLLYIGGIGLARGYWDDEEKTRAAFVTHPKTGEKLYRTGDIGRYLPDGNIEFLGRADFQVKIQGFRVELGEIEYALLSHPDINAAAVIASETSTGKQLIGFVVAGEGAQPGIETLQAFLRSKLPSYMVPASIVTLEKLPLTANGKLDRKMLDTLTPTAQQKKQQFAAARNDTEADLIAIWEEVLAMSPIGIDDDFFELGGQSFAAVRVMTRIAQQFGRRLALGVLLEGRTVASLAESLQQQAQGWTPLVPIREAGNGNPCFFIHPAGGNVLCYRTLAEKMDRPFYGLEAAGLSGEQIPLDDMVQMAALYLRSLRCVQPHGPYLLGGWSSGGMIAFEMARQLEQQGELVEHIFMLDTPAPLQHEVVDDVTLLLWFLEDINIGFNAASMQLNGLDDIATLSNGLAFAKQQYNISVDVDIAQLESIFAVFKGVIHACRHYRPTPIHAPVAVLRAREGSVSEFIGHPAAQSSDWGWRLLTDGHITCVPIAGSHHTILSEQHLDSLRHEINRILEGDSMTFIHETPQEQTS
jgi:yersiniabactin nonribosomal peptide synthetase